MTDAEISRRLALAIGWRDDGITNDGWPDPDVAIFSEDYGRVSWCSVWHNGDWRQFDYRDPAVIWPIAERFDCFPTLYPTTQWTAWIPGPAEYTGTADTAAKAVALAVIKAKEQR